jgi:hypothetical protein
MNSFVGTAGAAADNPNNPNNPNNPDNPNNPNNPNKEADLQAREQVRHTHHTHHTRPAPRRLCRARAFEFFASPQPPQRAALARAASRRASRAPARSTHRPAAPDNEGGVITVRSGSDSDNRGARPPPSPTHSLPAPAPGQRAVSPPEGGGGVSATREAGSGLDEGGESDEPAALGPARARARTQPPAAGSGSGSNHPQRGRSPVPSRSLFTRRVALPGGSGGCLGSAARFMIFAIFAIDGGRVSVCD